MPDDNEDRAFHPLLHQFSPKASRRNWPAVCDPQTWPEYAPAPVGPKGGMVTRSAVYRFYGKDQELLYVGITTNPLSRWQVHRHSEWWRHVRFMSVEPVDPATRLAAEQQAIKVEQPRFNVLKYATVKTVITFENGMADVVAQFRRRMSPENFADLVAAFKAEPDNASPTH